METIAAVETVARDAGLKLHLDGARLWNASVATGIPEQSYASHFDSVSVCFSKGLGAPVGSCLAGTAEFIQRARRFRKMFGGGMRQAGIIAAGALYALEHHRSRLAEDHANAKALARGLAALAGIELDPEEVETNILVIRLRGIPAPKMAERLKALGVLVLPTGADTVRAVTSLEVKAGDIPKAVQIFRKALAQT
jgi:threonine aldolase